jgi:hypothetical protein
VRANVVHAARRLDSLVLSSVCREHLLIQHIRAKRQVKECESEGVVGATMDSDGSAAMETDGTMVAVGTAGPAQAGAPVAMPPPHGIDALPYADKDYEVPGAREAVSVMHTHALLAADLITPPAHCSHVRVANGCSFSVPSA